MRDVLFAGLPCQAGPVFVGLKVRAAEATTVNFPARSFTCEDASPSLAALRLYLIPSSLNPTVSRKFAVATHAPKLPALAACK